MSARATMARDAASPSGRAPLPSSHGAEPGCGGELRCGCGSLLARVVGGSVELKCRRCKRIWTIPLSRR